jgi:predicted transcriptional regulator
MRSELLTRVLASLRDHPHDDTSGAIATRLGVDDQAVIEASLRVLLHDDLVRRGFGHWQLTHAGWTTARELDPYAGID